MALKEMIKNWLDDMYPKMAESDRIALSEAMDISLIEQKKTESMKTFFEINNVIRMSFIEMQYMKRVSVTLTPYCAHGSNNLTMDVVISGNDECSRCHG